MGEPYQPNYVTQHFKLVLRKNHLRSIRFHDLRHTCASLLLKNGVPMKDIQEWLGHSSYNTTANIYAHLDTSSKNTSASKMSNVVIIEPGISTSVWKRIMERTAERTAKNRVKWMLFMGEKKKRLMPQMLRDQAFRRMVPVVGLEPTRCRHRRILNPLRLPFHHTGTFYRETPKILIGENKERTHYKSHILL